MFIKITKLLYCLNLVFSYPLSIYPTNRTFERIAFGWLKDGTVLKYWVQNISRTFFVFLACFLSIVFSSTIDKFLGISGAVLGIPIILLVPTLCHLIIVAQTKTERVIDYLIIVFSIFVLILCSYKSINAYVHELSE